MINTQSKYKFVELIHSWAVQYRDTYSTITIYYTKFINNSSYYSDATWEIKTSCLEDYLENRREKTVLLGKDLPH